VPEIDGDAGALYLHCRYSGGAVKARVQRWGNSLAVRIPKAFASELRLDPGSAVELAVEDGTLSVRPSPAPEYRLDELLAGVTAANRHSEEDFGQPSGGEAW
jgi:antitoxin MazE